ncbi:MAG: hypothetical protein GIW99_07620 [Candidatus Eremiobacteraeota bacterium]|nr:hypothetical protein [Candidatus Eremiobacteraeota bacterium]MBC5827530.1 hypothetical protein [Candidatus Eremiobacteraeota bacterium]
MSAFVLCLIFLLTAVAASAPASAATRAHGHHSRMAYDPEAGPSDESAFTMSGTVASVDYDANVIVLAAHGDKISIAVTPTTAIEDRGQAGSFADIRRGSHVTISGTVNANERIAHTIVIK